MRVSTVAPRRVGTSLRLRHDDDLLLDVRAGIEEAYGEIYRRYEPEARSFARSLVGPDAVDDVVAGAFMKMLQALRSGHGPVNHPVRYLMVAVRSSANDHRARGARDRDVASRLIETDVAEDRSPMHEDDPLVVAFLTLSARWRQVLWWSEIEGQSPGEIGLRLGIKPAAAAALTYRARRALREAYLGADGDPSDPD